MSWLLFMDESGHDHKNMPFEVRGGIALHASEVWSFVCDFSAAEIECFGVRLPEYNVEIKGSKLLARDRFIWASQMQKLPPHIRHKSVRRFLTRKSQKEPPNKQDFTAYGQASLMMAHRIFDLLEKHGAVLFASLISRGCKPPKDYRFDHFLRKDHIFLQERFFYFLEKKQNMESSSWIRRRNRKIKDLSGGSVITTQKRTQAGNEPSGLSPSHCLSILKCPLPYRQRICACTA